MTFARSAQVIEKRMKMLKDMVLNLEAELRQDLMREGIATEEACEGIVDLLPAKMKSIWQMSSAVSADWYNYDDQFSLALQAMLRSKERLKAHATQAATEISRLQSQRPREVRLAIEALRRMPPEIIATQASALFATLNNTTDAIVRKAAVDVVWKLSPQTLAKHAASVMATLQRLKGSDASRKLAMMLLELPPETLESQPARVHAMLEQLKTRHPATRRLVSGGAAALDSSVWPSLPAPARSSRSF